jgi:hypothetical protein
MELYYNGELYKTANLSILEDVEKSSFWDVFLEVIKEIFLVS